MVSPQPDTHINIQGVQLKRYQLGFWHHSKERFRQLWRFLAIQMTVWWHSLRRINYIMFARGHRKNCIFILQCLNTNYSMCNYKQISVCRTYHKSARWNTSNYVTVLILSFCHATSANILSNSKHRAVLMSHDKMTNAIIELSAMNLVDDQLFKCNKYSTKKLH